MEVLTRPWISVVALVIIVFFTFFFHTSVDFCFLSCMGCCCFEALQVVLSGMLIRCEQVLYRLLHVEDGCGRCVPVESSFLLSEHNMEDT